MACSFRSGRAVRRRKFPSPRLPDFLQHRRLLWGPIGFSLNSRKLRVSAWFRDRSFGFRIRLWVSGVVGVLHGSPGTAVKLRFPRLQNLPNQGIHVKL